ncbi:MAG: glycosyl hydrolase, partial [Terriglobia bacterium]
MSQRHRSTGRAIYAIAALLLSVATGLAQSKTDPLKSGFENPPEGARPRVWWHWMNGNISKEGIKLDLEWMHRVGLGGYQNFDAALSTPQVVPKRLVYMTPEWKDAFKYAVVLGDQLGLEEAIAGSPGWSESGGPWVPASQGMKKYVWSETPVEGGQAFMGTVAHPPSNTGAFQNLSIRDLLERPEGSKPVPEFYADVAVVAYRVPESDVALESLHPKVTASGVDVDFAMLSDGDLEKATKLPIPTAAGQTSWIQYEFAEPQTIHAVSVVTKNPGSIAAMLAGIGSPEKSFEASDDGQNFRAVVKLADDGAAEHTVSFPAVKAKFFRVVFKRTPPPPLPAWASGIDPASLGIRVGKPPTDYEIAELVLHPGARVSRFEDKAAFSSLGDLYEFATPSVDSADAVSKSEVIDLTSKM